MSDTDVYRQAASILVLRPSSGGQHEILLLHKPRKNDAWQLPQGGVEAGETTEDAAIRELKEEASLSGCQVIGDSVCVYQYDFPDNFRKFRPDNVRGQKICFILALAPSVAPITVDGKEVDEYVWISPKNLDQYIKRKEYADLILNLYAEALAKIPPVGY